MILSNQIVKLKLLNVKSLLLAIAITCVSGELMQDYPLNIYSLQIFIGVNPLADFNNKYSSDI